MDKNDFANPTKPACSTCKHYIPYSNPPRCKAFPVRIPDSILEGEDDHRQPVRGDNGIQYESINGK